MTLIQDFDEFLASDKKQIKQEGFSQEFIAILEKAAYNKISLIILDRDGNLDPDLPSFCW
ncbi:hypothetical protein [Geoalkalibacter subterraneus]|uniref:DUF5983 domain-containing protein n=1 Tax=Geoalkalibacter subterraneus TaxID=483547 RepID=A0A0B5FX91_9BACT|nr:hypothetical protein [Geoalkalibacter subterraneus]AJF08216.1 hypothetical protein GSUB_17155 [Geoalkalibacter subterraneus]